MGARGKLKIATEPSEAVAAATAGTAAADVSPIAPTKPEAVAEDSELSALWDEIVPALDADGLLARSDALAVEMALRHFLAARQASVKLLQEGPVEFDEKNKRRMKNPTEVVFRVESNAFLQYANALGMTFVSRARAPSKDEGSGLHGSPFSGVG